MLLFAEMLHVRSIMLSKGDNPPIEDMILFAFYLGKLSAAREIQKKCEEGINDIIYTCKGANKYHLF